MASIEEELYGYIVAAVPLAGGRVYPLVLPQDAVFPAISYFRVSSTRVHSHSGPSGLAFPRFQFSCWGARYEDAREVAEQLRIALDGYSGAMGTVHIGAALIQADIDLYDPEVGLYHVPVDFIISHKE